MCLCALTCALVFGVEGAPGVCLKPADKGSEGQYIAFFFFSGKRNFSAPPTCLGKKINIRRDQDECKQL